MAATLSAADWKKVLKAHPDAAETAPLTKALEEYARAEDKGEPKPLLTALDQVVARAGAAKKKNAKNAKLTSYLDDVIDDAEAARKQAEREAAKSEVDDDLLPSLRMAMKAPQDKPLKFVFAPGKQVGGLVVGRNISGDQKKDAFALRDKNNGKEMSGSTLIKGFCYGRDVAEGEEGKLVFQMKRDPKSGLAKALMRTILKQTKKKFKVVAKGPESELEDEADEEDFDAEAVTEEEDEDEKEPEAEGETEAATGGQAEPGPADQVKAQAKETRALLDRLKEADAGRAAPLMTQFATALGHAQAGRHDQALALLGEVDGLARSALRAAEAAREIAGAKGADPSAAFQQRVDGLTDRLKDALRAGDDRAQDLKLKFSEARLFGRKQGFERANALLDELEEMLDSGEGDELERWGQEVAELEPDYLAALRSRPEQASTLRTIWEFAAGKAEAGDYDKATAALDRLRGLLAGGPEAPGKGEGKPADGMAAWQAARVQIVGQLRELASEIAASGHPNSRAAVIEIKAVVANLTAAPAGPRVAELVSWLETDDVVDEVCELAFDLRSPLLNALRKLTPVASA
jgi:hypothetical protein